MIKTEPIQSELYIPNLQSIYALKSSSSSTSDIHFIKEIKTEL